MSRIAIKKAEQAIFPDQLPFSGFDGSINVVLSASTPTFSLTRRPQIRAEIYQLLREDMSDVRKSVMTSIMSAASDTIRTFIGDMTTTSMPRSSDTEIDEQIWGSQPVGGWIKQLTESLKQRGGFSTQPTNTEEGGAYVAAARFATSIMGVGTWRERRALLDAVRDQLPVYEPGGDQPSLSDDTTHGG